MPPVGHAEPPVALVDEDLLLYETVWAAAGHTHVVFGMAPGRLPEITSGKVVGIKSKER